MADGTRPPAGASTRSNPLDGLNFGWRNKLPVILQAEAAECGLACLAMIACYHGHDVDLPGLRRRFSISLKGVDLKRIMSMAEDLGLLGRPLQLGLNELGRLQTPCILHWDLNHFVVLKKSCRKFVVLHDPAAGDQRMTMEVASRHFTGVALELVKAIDFEPVKERHAISLRALTGAVHGWIPALTQIFIMAIALEVFALVGPFYLQWVLDQCLVSADRDLLTLLAIGFGVLVILQTLVSAIRSWAVMWLGVRISVQWSVNLVRHLLRLPMDWYEKRHIGDITSRLSSAGAIQHALTMQVIGTILDGLMAMVSLIVMAMYSLRLTFIVVFLFVTYAILRWAFYKPLRRATEDNIVCSARQQSELLQIIRGAMSIKLANQESARSASYMQKMIDTANKGVVIKRLGITFASIHQIINGIGHVLLIWLAATLVLDGHMSAGMMMAFIAYAIQFNGRSGALIDTWIDFRMLRLHAERLADIALSQPESYAKPIIRNDLNDISIDVLGLSFRYAEGEPWVIKDCSFHIDSDSSLVIFGSSGCGKTTLIKILLGLLNPTEGHIYLGGLDIRKIGLQSYRHMIGAVMQEDKLFSGSIAENIASFDPIIDMKNIHNVAQLACIHEDILSMPMGYQTLTGDMGSNLSGGQKQRVFAARALYRKPKILIMDEGASHLDSKTKFNLSSNILKLPLTKIIATHDISVMSEIDNMLNLDEYSYKYHF